MKETECRNIYRTVYVMLIFAGAVISVEAVWVTADAFNALMMVPNLIGVVVLNKKVQWKK